MPLNGFLPGLLLLLALSVPTVAQSQSEDEKAVLAVVHRMFDGMRTADSAKVRSAFAGGARFASVDARVTPVTVKYEGLDGWLGGVANSARRWDEQVYDVQVRVDGEIAQVWAPYTFYLDRAVRHCGVNSLELLRDPTGWKITQLSDTRRKEGCKDPLAR